MCGDLRTGTMGRVKKALWALVILWGLILLGFGFLGCVEWGDAIAAPPLDGPTIEYVDEDHPFRVGILGDAQKGLANLSRIASAVHHENVAVMIQTGDLVARNDEGHYRLAQRYLSKGGIKRWPFVVPGNHDIKGGEGLFRRTFGGLEHSFRVGKVAFVLLNNASGVPPDPKHLEREMATSPPHTAVVLAMHQAPFDAQGNPKPGYEAFLAWLERSPVAYLLCGHEHGYLKKKVGETTVIINGVGGDYDTWQLDQKVYATILEVNGTSISDRSIELEPVHEVWENIEHFAIGHFAEAYRRRPLLCWGGTVLLAGMVGWAIWRIFANREPFRAAPG